MKPSIAGALGSLLLGVALSVPLAGLARADDGARRVSTAGARLPAQKLDSSLLNAKGTVEVIVQLSGEPLAVANGRDSHVSGGRMNRAQQIAYSNKLRSEQDAVLARIIALGGREVGRVHIAYNAAIVRIDASKAEKIANLPGVSSVQRSQDFRLNLSDTVEYVGAAAVHAAGITGKGVEIAVLDSGIDYTHRDLGGPGTVAAYVAAYGTGPTDPRNTTLDSHFPTDKVVGGYDFVGETWAGGDDTDRTEDPDPIDHAGHGTHVADILAGRSLDGTHVGVAPGATLLAVKVCSASVSSTACNGVAILKGLDFALDPNQDDVMDDAVDIINMSLGAPYGQKEDSTSVAASNAARAGIVVVAAAGNSSDKPYDLGSPGISPDVITVAQTQVPSAVAIPLVIKQPIAIKGTYLHTAVLDWAKVTDAVEQPVVWVGYGCPNDAYLANPKGKIALIDRGNNCDVSAKVARATEEGALGVLIGMDEEAPFSFSNGGTCPSPTAGPCVPSIVIEKTVADAIRANLGIGVIAQISPANGIFLSGSVASTTARGPSYDFNQIKPDIAAPGASVSALVGTGSGEEAFGGTSGSTPMVAGAAALMLEAYPGRAPWIIKSMLMNTADPDVLTDPVFLPNVLAPVTRIGAGELQVNRAIASTTAAWDAVRRTGSLSFGYHNVSDNDTFVRTVRVQNFSRNARRYDVSNAFRYSDDKLSGAVKIIAPASVFVPAFGSTTFDVALRVDASRLPTWTLFGGFNSGNGPLLQSVEFDGYLTLKDSKDTVRMPWHVLPHKSADMHVVNRNVRIPAKGFGMLALTNLGKALPGAVDFFNLTGTSPRLRPAQTPDEDETTVHDLAAVGVRATLDGNRFPIVQFAINTYQRRAHPAYPGRFDVLVDSDLDGKPDFHVFNTEFKKFDTTGQAVVAVEDLHRPLSDDELNPNPVVYYYADADLDSGNLIMSVPPESIGVVAGKPFRFDVEAHDNYFHADASDGLTDSIRRMVFTIDSPKYTLSAENLPQGGLPPRSGLLLKVEDHPGNYRLSPSQTGFLMMYRDARDEAETVTVFKAGR